MEANKIAEKIRQFLAMVAGVRTNTNGRDVDFPRKGMTTNLAESIADLVDNRNSFFVYCSLQLTVSLKNSNFLHILSLDNELSSLHFPCQRQFGRPTEAHLRG